MNIQPQSDQATQSDIRAGLSWGIKHSFNRYVDAMPDGQRAAGAGATEMPDGTFFFELDDAGGFDAVACQGVIKYQGDVRYKAHRGVLFVMIVDPWLEFNDGRGQLSVVDATHWPSREQRMVLATLEPTPGQGPLPPGWMSMDAKITPAGVELFNNVYSVGESLAPVRFSIMT